MTLSPVFYASGTRGPAVRGDGHGGALARGWYARTLTGQLLGPFRNEITAWKQPGVEYRPLRDA